MYQCQEPADRFNFFTYITINVFSYDSELLQHIPWKQEVPISRLLVC